jgi:hypothetical protein
MPYGQKTVPCFPCWPPALPLREGREGLFLRLSRLTIPCLYTETSVGWTYQGMLTFESTLLKMKTTGMVYLEWLWCATIQSYAQIEKSFHSQQVLGVL